MTDHRVVLLVVAILGVFALGGLGGTIYLIALDKSASDLNVIITPTATALGALAAVLVSTRATPIEPTPVVGEDGGPVEVAEVAPPSAGRLRARGASDLVVIIGCLIVAAGIVIAFNHEAVC